MSIVGLLVALVILCLVVWVIRSLLAAFSVGEPISTIVWVIVVIIVIVYLLQLVGFNTGLHFK